LNESSQRVTKSRPEPPKLQEVAPHLEAQSLCYLQLERKFLKLLVIVR
jgi:hypothetical protein